MKIIAPLMMYLQCSAEVKTTICGSMKVSGQAGFGEMECKDMALFAFDALLAELRRNP